MPQLAFEMATYAAAYQLSALGAEAIVAAKHLDVPPWFRMRRDGGVTDGVPSLARASG